MPGEYVKKISANASSIIEKALAILEIYPLCDHCLGRLFARYGRAMGNDERGRAIKTIIAMALGSTIPREVARVIAGNGGGPIARLYEALYSERLEPRKCAICGGVISRRYFEELADKVISEISRCNASSFLIGVSIDRDTFSRELEILSIVGIDYGESIKNEIKREVGKIVKERTGIEPDFEKPDVVVIIDYPGGTVRTLVNPILLSGRYWKKARNISHTVWSIGEVKKYPYSIEEFLSDSIRELYDAERVVLHASGREDVDARMLGTGRPMVVEVKNPRFRLVDRELVNSLLRSPLIDAHIIGDASRETIKLLKTDLSKKEKVYKALVATKEPIGEHKLRELEEFFRNRVVRQLTPTRILRRKKEHERIRRVYEVRAHRIAQTVFEALIRSDGGLYIKELVSGDQGRTEPSFASFLGVEAYCVELDVIGVEVYLPRVEKPLN